MALAFEDELSAGYSHMRDDDPRSLNDDYVRTFTVSSAMGRGLPHDEFEITFRNVVSKLRSSSLNCFPSIAYVIALMTR